MAVRCLLACDGVTYNLLVDNLIIRRSRRDQDWWGFIKCLERFGQGRARVSYRLAAGQARLPGGTRGATGCGSCLEQVQCQCRPGGAIFNYLVNISLHIKNVQLAIINIFKLPHLPRGLSLKAIQTTRVKCLIVSSYYTYTFYCGCSVIVISLNVSIFCHKTDVSSRKLETSFHLKIFSFSITIHWVIVLEITLNSIARTTGTKPRAAGINVNSVISKLIKSINSVPWQASKY